MTEAVVSFVLQELSEFVKEEGSSLTGIERNFKDIKDEIESIQTLLKDADTNASDGGGGVDKGLRAWMKQLRESSFRIEDLIDEYNMYVAQRVNESHFGFVALLQKISYMISTLKLRYHIAHEIRDIKSSVAGIKKKRSKMIDSQSENGPGCSRGTKAARFANPEMDSHFVEETQVVGFESPRDELVSCLMGETNECILVSVVGMGGQGKTTLAKYVFDNKEVTERFKFRFFFSVSQSYTMRELLTDMIKMFCKNSKKSIPNGLQEMNDKELITQVRRYLKPKRYLIWFDDVSKEDFSDGIKHAMADNNNGSRILVTTRMMHVAEYFLKSFHVHVHELQPLPLNKAWELFCNKAFRSLQGQCPAELEAMSKEIVQKCGGLPMAIVSIAGLLSTTARNTSEWRRVSQNLIMELERNAHLTNLTMILSRSYDDLPCHLKSCILYFGIYPEHYTINCKRLTRQWIAEGFVKRDEGRTLEEVAEEYLKELRHTSLVKVSIGFDGKIKSCQVHDLLRHIIIRKMKDESFCHIMYEDHEQVTVGITRRFSIAACSNDVLRSNSNTGIRAIFVFDKGELPQYFIDSLSVKFKLIKVLDFEHSLLKCVPKNLGNLFHLTYLNLSHTKVTVLPGPIIGNLVNLEILDLRQTQVYELPMEINKLTKLRLLQVYHKRYEAHYSMFNFTTGVRMQEGIGGLESLQNLYYLEADHGGIDRIQELKMLKKLRKLGIRFVRREYRHALCAAVQQMNFLESLSITAIDENEILDLDIESAPPCLRVLKLKARLTRLPDWIPRLDHLVKLILGFSNFVHDPLDSLKNLPNLLRLYMWDDAFVGERLHFQIGGFLKLKELDLTRLNRLSSVSIDNDALLCLEKFRFKSNPQLMVLPQDLQHLENLQFLEFADMPAVLVESIDPESGRQRHIINHIPDVRISQRVESISHDYESHPFNTLSNG